MELRNVWILAQKEWSDAFRNRWFMLYTLVFGILALALSWLGLAGIGGTGLAGFGRTGASLINLVLLIVPLMGLTLGALSLAGERERGTLLYLLAQPISRTEILLGKYLGLALALGVSLGLGFGLSGLPIVWYGGTAQAGTYLSLLGLAFLLSLASLSLGMLASAASPRGSTAIGLALFLWLLLVYVGDLGVLGTALVMKLRVGELLTLAFVNPLQVFKIAAIFAIHSSLDILGPGGLYALRTYGSRLMPLLLVLLLAWTLVPLGLTYLMFRQRGVI